MLSMVEKRPVMYLGVAESERGIQLDRVEMLISGYIWALRLHGLSDPGFDLFETFPAYLEKRCGWTVARGRFAR
jgi:hypothetical protein